MAYRKQKDRVLAGSLNLLPPGDLTPAPDSLRLQNWRVDQAGALRSRRGLHKDASGLGYIHSLFRSGDDRYGGEAGNLRYGANLSATVASGFDGEPLGFAAMQDFTWVMNRSKQGKAQANNWYSWVPDTPANAPFAYYIDGGTRYTGAFTFYVTFATADGHESGPSPPSDLREPQDMGLGLQQIATIPADSNATMRHIYGIGGDLNRPLRFLTINDKDTDECVLTATIEEVQNLNIAMPVDYDAPPPARGLLGPYLGRLIAWSSRAHPNRLWWTPTAKPWAWPGANDESEGYWIDVGDEDEDLLNVTHRRDLLLIYKERSIWRIAGDPGELGVLPERTNANIGAAGVQAVCTAGSYDYVRGPKGIYRFNGDYEQKVSVKIDPIFKGDQVQMTDSYSLPPLDPTRDSYSVLAYSQGRLYFSYTEEAGSVWADVTLVYEEDSQRWYQHRMRLAGPHTGGFSTLYDEGGDPGHALLGGIGGGYLYQLDQGETDDGLAIPLIWQSSFKDQGIPDNEKVYADLVIDYRTALAGQTPSTLTVKMIYDNGTDEAVGSIVSSERTTSIFPLGADDKGRKALNASVLVEGDATSTVIIYAVYIHWYAEARWAKTFDSGVVDLGGVNQLDELEFDITALGTVNWAVHTDLPGGAVGERATSTFAATSDRETVPARFTVAEGRRARLLVWSEEPFQLHGIKWRVKPIGEYIDGAAGDYWESAPVG